MRKILFLFLICLIKLNAFEYLIYDNVSSTGTTLKEVFFVSRDGIISKRVLANGNYTYGDINVLNNFYQIKYNFPDYKYNRETFTELFKSDLVFLNAMFTQGGKFTNGLLNFLYNNKPFGELYGEYIEYDYVLLYNSEGLAVESIVGGVWKGLYDTPENSGLLYDRKNNILYNNGNVSSLFDRFWYALTGNVSKTLKVYYISMLGLNIFILILAVYLVKVLLGLIIKWVTTIINNTKVNVNLGALKRW